MGLLEEREAEQNALLRTARAYRIILPLAGICLGLGAVLLAWRLGLPTLRWWQDE